MSKQSKNEVTEEVRKELRQMVVVDREIDELREKVAALHKKYIAEHNVRISDLMKKSEELRSNAEVKMAKHGIKELFDKLFKAVLRDVKPKLEVVDESKVPDSFCEFKRVVKKVELNKFFKETETVPAGCALTEGAWVLAVEKAKE